MGLLCITYCLLITSIGIHKDFCNYPNESKVAITKATTEIPTTTPKRTTTEFPTTTPKRTTTEFPTTTSFSNNGDYKWIPLTEPLDYLEQLVTIEDIADGRYILARDSNITSAIDAIIHLKIFSNGSLFSIDDYNPQIEVLRILSGHYEWTQWSNSTKLPQNAIKFPNMGNEESYICRFEKSELLNAGVVRHSNMTCAWRSDTGSIDEVLTHVK